VTPDEWVERLGPVLFARSVVGVTLVSPDGYFLRPNRAYCEILERPEAELEGLTFVALTHPADVLIDEQEAARVRALTLDGYAMRKRYKMRQPDAAGNPVYRWVTIYVSALTNDDGLFEYYLVQCARAPVDQIARPDAMPPGDNSAAIRADLQAEIKRIGWELDRDAKDKADISAAVADNAAKTAEVLAIVERGKGVLWVGGILGGVAVVGLFAWLATVSESDARSTKNEFDIQVIRRDVDRIERAHGQRNGITEGDR